MGMRYRNPYGGDLRRSLWDVVLWKTGRYNEKTVREALPKDFTYPAAPAPYEEGKPSVLWVGHSTFLIEIGGFFILTDPVWDAYCSPIPIRALRRRHDPFPALADLPSIDLVLLSHNHYDHLDAKTVRHLHAFHPHVQWVVPLGLSRWFRKRGIERVCELGWWESKKVGDGVATAVPAQHFSGRGLWDQNKTFWNGYVFEKGDKRFYFTGDTGYNGIHFKEIGARWPFMDLSLIPIGTYIPERFMQPVHCSPHEAVEIHCDVRSRFSLGMHWKTFCLSDEPMERPPYDLYLAMQRKNLSCEAFLPVEPGIFLNW